MDASGKEVLMSDSWTGRLAVAIFYVGLLGLSFAVAMAS